MYAGSAFHVDGPATDCKAAWTVLVCGTMRSPRTAERRRHRRRFLVIGWHAFHYCRYPFYPPSALTLFVWWYRKGVYTKPRTSNLYCIEFLLYCIAQWALSERCKCKQVRLICTMNYYYYYMYHLRIEQRSCKLAVNLMERIERARKFSRIWQMESEHHVLKQLPFTEMMLVVISRW